MTTRYDSPLVTRYATAPMAAVFAPLTRARRWRELWLVLLRNQRRLGLAIPAAAEEELAQHLDDIDLAAVATYEKELRHDVMAHVHALGDVAPTARPFLHLGATSCYVTDNGDVMALREALDLLLPKLAGGIRQLADFASTYAELPTLGFTHFQAAQPTTVGKRASLWVADLLDDLARLSQLRDGLRLRGAKGTTGTQASYLALFDGDEAKVRQLDASIAADLDFPGVVPVTGQTYSRKVDHDLVSALGSLAMSLHKLGTDLRLLAHLKEVEEPFGRKQIGSSAMAYKRNPMRSERLCSLSRHVMSQTQNTAWTGATQWLERTLDDSANRRLSLAEAFLATDGCLEILLDVSAGLVVNPAVIRRRLAEELPFMATEEILMAMVRAGADRQTVHERIRVHSVAAATAVKRDGLANDLLERLAADEAFAPVHAELHALMQPERFIGCAPSQVHRFVAEWVEPALAPWADRLQKGEGLRV